MKKSLKINLVSLFSFSILDRIISGFLNVIIFTLLIRFIPQKEVGLLGLFSGIFVFFNFINLSPVTIIMRDYKKIKDIGREFGNFIIFNIYKTLIFLIISLAISFIYSLNGYGNKMYLFILYVLSLSLMNIANIATEGLYVSFNQIFLFIINLCVYLFQLIFYIYFFTKPHYRQLVFYLISQIFIMTFYVILTFYIFLHRVKARLTFKMDWKKFFKDNIFEFSLWNHFNGAITFLIYRIDTFVLSFFTTIEKLAVYTVALTFSNYFFIIPQIGEKVLRVGFSRVENGEEEKRLALWGTLFLDLISILQMVIFFLFGKWLIRFLFPTTDYKMVYQLSALILLGITILNLARPINAHLFVQTKMKNLFLKVFLPSGVFALLTYFILAKLFNIMGVALGNIISYLFFAILIFIYEHYYGKATK